MGPLPRYMCPMTAPRPVHAGAPNPLWEAWRGGAAPAEGSTCGACAWRHLGGRGAPVPRCQRHAQARVHDTWPACPAFLAELDCADCGACCREAFHVVEVGARDPFVGRHGALLEREDGRLVLRRTSEGRCPCLQGQLGSFRCDRYEDRPRTCRDFTLGSANCADARRRVGLTP